MGRAGLTADRVIAMGAQIADELGYGEVTLARVAARAGVRPPSLFKHVDNLADLQHRIAALAMTELGETIRDAIQGRSGFDALADLVTAVRAYVTAHPGRYAATIGAEFTGPDDPLLAASTRVIDSIAAVLRGYAITDAEMDHAIRTLRCTLHGFAVLQAANAFQWSGDPDQSFDWMIRFLDRGLRIRPRPPVAVEPAQPKHPHTGTTHSEHGQDRTRPVRPQGEAR